MNPVTQCFFFVQFVPLCKIHLHFSFCDNQMCLFKIIIVPCILILNGNIKNLFVLNNKTKCQQIWKYMNHKNS